MYVSACHRCHHQSPPAHLTTISLSPPTSAPSFFDLCPIIFRPPPHLLPTSRTKPISNATFNPSAVTHLSRPAPDFMAAGPPPSPLPIRLSLPYPISSTPWRLPPLVCRYEECGMTTLAPPLLHLPSPPAPPVTLVSSDRCTRLRYSRQQVRTRAAGSPPPSLLSLLSFEIEAYVTNGLSGETPVLRLVAGSQSSYPHPILVHGEKKERLPPGERGGTPIFWFLPVAASPSIPVSFVHLSSYHNPPLTAPINLNL